MTPDAPSIAATCQKETGISVDDSACNIGGRDCMFDGVVVAAKAS